MKKLIIATALLSSITLAPAEIPKHKDMIGSSFRCNSSKWALNKNFTIISKEKYVEKRSRQISSPPHIYSYNEETGKLSLSYFEYDSKEHPTFDFIIDYYPKKKKLFMKDNDNPDIIDICKEY